ncbi:MAG: hypothetical protein AMXMBFR33_46170 [Candidatus Xenobia bacterium]
MLIVLACLVGRVGFELAYDIHDGGRRADRWFTLTGPLLEAWRTSPNAELRAYARQALSRQPYPRSLQWLLEELSTNPEEQCQLTREDWLRYRLDEPGSQQAALRAALTGAVEPGSFCYSFLAQFSQQFPADSWVWPEIVKRAEQPDGEALRALLPYRLPDEPVMGSPEFRAAVATVNRGGEAGPPLATLTRQEHEHFLRWVAVHRPERLPALFSSATGRCKAMAAILLLGHEESPVQVRPWLEQQANRELSALAGYQLSRGLLAELARALPESRFARGCSDYLTLRGGGDFNEGSDRLDLPTRRRLIQSAGRDEKCWRNWLACYPGHPQADEATYWLARSLEWQGKRKQAFALVMRQLVTPVGDASNQDDFRSRLLWMLDVGLTAGELADFVGKNPRSPLTPLASYALSVRAARQHQYARALNLSQRLSLDRAYRLAFGADWRPSFKEVELRSLALSLSRQRQHWQSMLGARREQLASRWSREDGWQLGYLFLYSGDRKEAMASGDNYVDSLAVLPCGRPDAELIRRHYQQASSQAVALALLRKLPQNEHVMFTQIRLLHEQRRRGQHESLAMAPLQGLPDPEGEPYYAFQIECLTRQLEEEHPESHYCDDALMLCYQASSNRAFLDEIRVFYPDGDQVLLLPEESAQVRAERQLSEL